MFDIFIDGICGALAAVFAYFLAKAFVSPQINPRRYRVLFVVFAVVGFQGMKYGLGPQIRSWKGAREIDGILADDRFFSVVLSDNPALREPVRAALLKAYAAGDRRAAAAAGQTLLGEVLPTYLSKASDASLLTFTQNIVNTLTLLASRDPNRCYQYLFPNVAGSTILGAGEGGDALMEAMRGVIISAHDHPVAPTEGSGKGILEELGSRLAAKYGDDVLLLKKTTAPDVDRAKVCTMTIGLYTEVLALPPAEVGPALRILYAR